MISGALQLRSSLIAMAMMASTVAAPAAEASTYAPTVLHSFAQSEAAPTSLTLGSDGNFYGTAGGAYGMGTIFRITPQGIFTTLHTFDAADSNGENVDGVNPLGLTEGADGSFYGAAAGGGANGSGTLFKITPAGDFMLLHTFSAIDPQTQKNADGRWPSGPLIAGRDGNFYGTTSRGGTNYYHDGVVFRLKPDGKVSALKSFSKWTGTPSSVIQARDGNFYGTTVGGGAPPASAGTVFKLTPKGKLTTLYTFTGLLSPSSLIEGDDGNFYGTTHSSPSSFVYTLTPPAEIFRLSPDARYLVLHVASPSWATDTDGDDYVAFRKGSDGKFYGIARTGPFNAGTIFRVAADGEYMPLALLGLDPTMPLAPNALTFGADGNIYGTSYSGGANSAGTVYELPLPAPADWNTGPAPAVSLTLSAPTIHVLKEESATLSWSSSGAGWCYLLSDDHAADLGTVATNGSMTVKPPRAYTREPNMYGYSVSCGRDARAAMSVVVLTVKLF